MSGLFSVTERAGIPDFGYKLSDETISALNSIDNSLSLTGKDRFFNALADKTLEDLGSWTNSGWYKGLKEIGSLGLAGMDVYNSIQDRKAKEKEYELKENNLKLNAYNNSLVQWQNANNARNIGAGIANVAANEYNGGKKFMNGLINFGLPSNAQYINKQIGLA